jgi:Tol biopolymer transport system component
VPKPKPLALATLVAALLALPTVAHATLTFARNPLHPQVWVADDNGKHAHELLAGSNPRISPDGRIVALLRQGTGRNAQPELVLAPTDGSAPPSVLVKGWRNPYVFAWSPDSKSVAAVLGPELGTQRLVLIDTEDGSQLTVASGSFNGVSFDPEGGAIAYGRAPSEKYPPKSDVYRFDIPPPGAVFVKAPTPVRLTADQRSLNPVWGPSGTIAFAKLLGAKKRKYGPKNELYLMTSAGKQVRRLTHTKVDPLALGLAPTAWSPDGSRLLAQFGGQDLTYAVAVSPTTGYQRPLVEATEQGFVGTGFSANGKLVLGYSGGGDPGLRHDVETVPYGGGKAKVLAKNAFEPSWAG